MFEINISFTLVSKSYFLLHVVLVFDMFSICSNFDREEADELCRTLEESEDKSRTASEMADVLYHAMVLLAVKEVDMEAVLQILRQRFSQSGIEEKKSRAPKS